MHSRRQRLPHAACRRCSKTAGPPQSRRTRASTAPACAPSPQRLKATDANVHGVVVVRSGKLVFEQYFAGHDMPWGRDAGRYEFDATTQHDMRSVTKSVVSLLLGIALDRKLIANLDEPVLKFFPEYAELKTPDWEKITLRHLVKMSSGQQWDENLPWDPKNDEWHLVNDADPLRYVFQKPFAFPPDTVWTYNGGSSDLLGKVIEKASGTPIDAFAREALFEPLGITDWQLMNYRNGKVATAAGLRLRPRDAAKIGQLMLDKGNWNGRQIVSAEWIAEFDQAALSGDQHVRRSVLLWLSVVDRPHPCRRQGRDMDRWPGPRRPAPVHRTRP